MSPLQHHLEKVVVPATNQTQFNLREQSLCLWSSTSHQLRASKSNVAIISTSGCILIDVAFSIVANAEVTAIGSCRIPREGCASRGRSLNTERLFAWRTVSSITAKSGLECSRIVGEEETTKSLHIKKLHRIWIQQLFVLARNTRENIYPHGMRSIERIRRTLKKMFGVVRYIWIRVNKEIPESPTRNR